MTFKNWLNTFIEEKNIDLEDTFEVMGSSGVNIMPYQVVVDAILSAPASEQKAIKEMIVKIDFKNGDVRHYFRHLSQAIAA